MQYKMLNEVLEVAMEMQPKPLNDQSVLEALKEYLIDKSGWSNLTVKQKRVLNALQTVCDGEQLRKKRAESIKQVPLGTPVRNAGKG
jgi:hypothetical protein